MIILNWTLSKVLKKCAWFFPCLHNCYQNSFRNSSFFFKRFFLVMMVFHRWPIPRVAPQLRLSSVNRLNIITSWKLFSMYRIILKFWKFSREFFKSSDYSQLNSFKSLEIYYAILLSILQNCLQNSSKNSWFFFKRFFQRLSKFI